jgi:hypothetical protein
MSNDELEGARSPSFSQRHGYSPYDSVMQIEALDERARIDLWNFVIYPRYLNVRYPDTDGLLIWTGHLGFPRDRYRINELAAKLNDVLHNGEWYEPYDLLEFLLRHTAAQNRQELTQTINDLLALNRAGYRVVDGQVIPITSAEEVESITAAANSPLANARVHMKRALELFAERTNPNFAKVIAEAMSAAESAANVLAGTQGLTLAAALKEVQKSVPPVVHSALAEGWNRIYGFTSDSGGIRHALKDGTMQPDQDLAQYFVITCSAFVNLVAAISTARQSGA